MHNDEMLMVIALLCFFSLREIEKILFGQNCDSQMVFMDLFVLLKDTAGVLFFQRK